MFTILHIKEQDIDAVTALDQSCFTYDAWTQEDFEMTMHSPIDTVWVYRDAMLAERKGLASDLIGYCVLRIIGDEAEILKICVTPELRRAGAADLMMDVMMQKCQENFVGKIWLEVRAQNTAALALYQKHGFAEQNIRKAYYREPVDDAVILLKSDYAYEQADHCCGQK